MSEIVERRVPVDALELFEVDLDWGRLFSEASSGVDGALVQACRATLALLATVPSGIGPARPPHMPVGLRPTPASRRLAGARRGCLWSAAGGEW